MLFPKGTTHSGVVSPAGTTHSYAVFPANNAPPANNVLPTDATPSADAGTDAFFLSMVWPLEKPAVDAPFVTPAPIAPPALLLSPQEDLNNGNRETEVGHNTDLLFALAQINKMVLCMYKCFINAIKQIYYSDMNKRISHPK